MGNNRFTTEFTNADTAFNGQYASALKQLKKLSVDEIKAITPSTTTLQAYKELTVIVEEASKKNLTQAQLIKNIKDLGDTAVKIAKKIPGLSKLL